MKNEAQAVKILQHLRNKGFEAYFAGGCVRDRLRGVPPSDFDIATSAPPDEVQKLFEKTVPVGVQFGVVLVIEDGEPYEVATFRAEGGYQDGRHPTQVKFTNVQADAERRDFTVNGLYFDPVANQTLDFVEGLKDLKAGVIRTIGDPSARFLEDHLRLLRAVRFAVQLNFTIEPGTLTAVKKHAGLITSVSPERIRVELVKILTSARPADGVRLLDQTGLLAKILPEVETMKGVEQPIQFHPEGDVFIHTMMLLDGLKNAPIELAMGALLHDVAKPATFVRAADRIRFHGHDRIGAEMTEVICKRLTFPNDQTELICALVAHHLRFKDAKVMRVATLKRFVSMPRFDLHLELHRLDCMASHKMLEAHEFCSQKYQEYLASPPPPLRMVTGKDLIALGFKPSPQFSDILRQIEDAILEGTLQTKEQALEFVKSRFSPL